MQRTRVLCLPDADPATDSAAVFPALCRDAAEHLGADLVSVWLFDSIHQTIECRAAYDAPRDLLTSGQVLRRSDYPRYFQHLIEETVVVANHARTHPWTRELAETYFEPQGIWSLLDFILHDGETPLGVICCETRLMVRAWTRADADYLRMLTAVASRYFWRASGRIAA